MPDLKKVLAGLKCCASHECYAAGCPYYDNEVGIEDCTGMLAADAITMLSDQNEKIISLKRERAILREKTQVVHCKDCVLWVPNNAEEGDTSGRCQNRYGVCEGQTTDMMWYCADGMKEEP